MKKIKEKRNRWGLLIVLSLIVIACLSLWYMRNYHRVDHMVRIKSDNSVFDVTDVDFSKNFVRLEGKVSYIQGILTPDEFAQREGEVQEGNPWNISSATSCVRIRVPDGGTYTITTASIDFAHKVYVNGELRFTAGVPAESKEEFRPGHAQMTLEVTPVNGVIEIVQQGANFVHREGGGHSNFYFGRHDKIQRFLSLTFGPEYIIVGLFAALFLVHLVLYLVRPSYKPNLIFSLLCLMWTLRTGVTGAKVFYAMFPALPWQLAFRVEYLSLPSASILMVLLAWEVFPQIPQKWFVRTVAAVSAGFSVLCIMADTVLLSWSLMAFEGFFTLSIVYLCIRFIMKVPGMVKSQSFLIEQSVSLVGFGIFMFAAINDALHHLGIPYYLGLKNSFAMTGLAMLIFSFFQMTAMFYGTMRETALAHERERKAEAEKEMLSEMNRLKNAFYTDLSHEMKTPLTVIAVNAQFAAQNIGAGAVDDETMTDLHAISSEAKRLAQMVTSLVGIGRIQGSLGENGQLALDSLITETARIYQTLFARKKNTLTAVSQPDLPAVEGNADQIIQVLINLLSNANRHTVEGSVCINASTSFNGKLKMENGELKGEDNSQLSTLNSPLYVVVSVTDTGEGIAADLLPHVFERYCHGEKGGSGLGLAICKTIIEEHGGEMGIESEEGKGTTVWFTIPAIKN